VSKHRDIGLTNSLALPFFKILGGVSPHFASILILPLALVALLVYKKAVDIPVLYIVALIIIYLRLILVGLSDLLAKKRGSFRGNYEMLCRITSEIFDILILLGLIMTDPKLFIPGAWALALGWLSTFFELVGPIANKPRQRGGPVSATARMVALMAASLGQFFSLVLDWGGFDFILLFFLWCILGGVITIGIRAFRIVKTEIP